MQQESSAHMSVIPESTTVHVALTAAAASGRMSGGTSLKAHRLYGAKVHASSSMTARKFSGVHPSSSAPIPSPAKAAVSSVVSSRLREHSAAALAGDALLELAEPHSVEPAREARGEQRHRAHVRIVDMVPQHVLRGGVSGGTQHARLRGGYQHVRVLGRVEQLLIVHLRPQLHAF
eukprot:scaffold20497_cov69-Phaeocystis_antarctica.AAC.5